MCNFVLPSKEKLQRSVKHRVYHAAGKKLYSERKRNLKILIEKKLKEEMKG